MLEIVLVLSGVDSSAWIGVLLDFVECVCRWLLVFIEIF